MDIKEIVKRHFNLIDAPTPESFATIKTADGELELKYEGDELAQGLEVFVVTADGDVAAPDGEHALEGGITIVTKDGKIEAIKETEAPAEEAEVEVEEVAAAEHEEEKMEEKVEEALEEEAELAEHEEEEMEDEAESIKETVIEEVIEAVAEVVTEKMKEMEEKLKAMEEKYAAFAKSPATSKTNALKNFSKTQKSDEAPAKNQAMIDALIAKKRKK